MIPRQDEIPPKLMITYWKMWCIVWVWVACSVCLSHDYASCSAPAATHVIAPIRVWSVNCVRCPQFVIIPSPQNASAARSASRMRSRPTSSPETQAVTGGRALAAQIRSASGSRYEVPPAGDDLPVDREVPSDDDERRDQWPADSPGHTSPFNSMSSAAQPIRWEGGPNRRIEVKQLLQGLPSGSRAHITSGAGPLISINTPSSTTGHRSLSVSPGSSKKVSFGAATATLFDASSPASTSSYATSVTARSQSAGGGRVGKHSQQGSAAGCLSAHPRLQGAALRSALRKPVLERAQSVDQSMLRRVGAVAPPPSGSATAETPAKASPSLLMPMSSSSSHDYGTRAMSVAVLRQLQCQWQE